MTNLPSTPSSANHEAPKGLSFRSLIFLVLAGFAVAGLGGYLLGKLSEAKSNKSKVTDARGARGSSSGNKYPDGWIPADKDAEELINLAQCRLLVLSLDSRVISNNEILQLAEKIQKDKQNATAEDIFKNFCINNTSDREAIRDAIAKGLKFKRIEKRSDDGWIIIFEKKVEEEGRTNERSISLDDEGVCKILTAKEKADLEKMKAERKKLKKMVDNIFNGLLDQAVSHFDVNKMDDEARELGIENANYIKLLRMAIDEAKKSIASAKDEDAAKAALCKINSYVRGAVGFIDSDIEDKIKDNPNFPLDDLNLFMETYKETLGLGVDLDGECALISAGLDK